MERFDFIAAKPSRLDVFLTGQMVLSRSFIQEQIRKGNVLINGKPVGKASQKVLVGDRIEGALSEDTPLELMPIRGDLDILYEDANLVAINKPQGLVVHPAPGHKGETLVHYLLYYLQKDTKFLETSELRPGIIHRLDKGTSGVILVAKNRPALANLSEQFKSRIVTKEYEALVWGKLNDRGVFRASIGRDPHDRKKMSSKSTKGRDATTEFRVTKRFAHFSLVSLFPHTGRTHQLRVHLSEARHPIVGDLQYGSRTRQRSVSKLSSSLSFVESLSHPLLHARRISFSDPESLKTITLEAPLPSVFRETLVELEIHDRTEKI